MVLDGPEQCGKFRIHLNLGATGFDKRVNLRRRFNFILVEKCTIGNGGCSHGCTNPTVEGGSVTCDCKDTPMVLDGPSDCGKFRI